MVSILPAVLGDQIVSSARRAIKRGNSMSNSQDKANEPEFAELNNPYINLSEGKELSTPTLNSLIDELCEEEYCDSQEFLAILTKLHDLIGLTEIMFVNEYFRDGNGWPIMDQLARKQHIVNYVYVNMGVRW